MTRLSDEAYLDHIRSESARFREVLASADPATRVPTCPDWDAADLLWHLTEVQHGWEWVIAHRPATPQEDPPLSRPQAYTDLLALFDERSTAFVETLGSADPAEPAWSWHRNQTVAFTYRRQAHEALIHRLDAELTAGTVTDLDPRLAGDGVQEALDVMFGDCPPWGTFTPGEELLRVDLIDTDQHVWVRLGRFAGTDPEGTSHDEVDINVVEDPGTEPDLVISGTAAELDAWLWHRGDDAGISVAGHRAVFETFRACVDQPID